MRARLSIMLVTALVMVLASLLSPAAFAQEEDGKQQNQQRDPNEGEPKHEINELQNRLQQTDDESKQNHIEGKIDALQEQRQEDADASADSEQFSCIFLGILSLGWAPVVSQFTDGRPCGFLEGIPKDIPGWAA